MGRPRRCLPAGTIAHVVNRSVDRRTIFHDSRDYCAFMLLLHQGREKAWVETLGYCVMPNHFHLILKASVDNGISRFMKWLTGTHAIRYRTFHENLGNGHLYHGRFRAVVITDDAQFLTALRYVEANACKAGLVRWGDDWEWCSSFERKHPEALRIVGSLPVQLPSNWWNLVNRDSPRATATEGGNELPDWVAIAAAKDRNFWKGV
jgi:putative transposase